ncbi:hypothetical protein MRX96_042440 [Rhipicephalus microplus]
MLTKPFVFVVQVVATIFGTEAAEYKSVLTDPSHGWKELHGIEIPLRGHRCLIEEAALSLEYGDRVDAGAIFRCWLERCWSVMQENGALSGSAAADSVEGLDMEYGDGVDAGAFFRCWLERRWSIMQENGALSGSAAADSVEGLHMACNSVHLHSNQIKSFDATFGTRSYWGFGASGSWDVAIVLMPRFTGTVLRYFKDSDGRLMSMDLDSGIRIRKVHETPELDGDMWDEVKAGAAECFRSWGKRRARKERAEIRIISGVIFLLSRPESTGPGIASTLATLRKELREALR